MGLFCWVLLLALSCSIWIHGTTTTTATTTTTTSTTSSSSNHKSRKASEQMASALSTVGDGILPVAVPARESRSAQTATTATPTAAAAAAAAGVHQAQIPLFRYWQILHLLQPYHQAFALRPVVKVNRATSPDSDREVEDDAGAEAMPRVPFLKRINEDDSRTDYTSTTEMTRNGDHFPSRTPSPRREEREQWYPGSILEYPQRYASDELRGELFSLTGVQQRKRTWRPSSFSQVTHGITCLPDSATPLGSRNRSNANDCSCTTRSYNMSMTCQLRSDDREEKENRMLEELFKFSGDRGLWQRFPSPMEVVLTHHCLQGNTVCRDVMCDCNLQDLLTKASRSRHCLQHCSAACNSTAISLHVRSVPRCPIARCSYTGGLPQPLPCDASYQVLLVYQ